MDRQIDIWMDGQIDRYIDHISMYRQKDIDRQINRQKDIDRQINRQIDRQIDSLTSKNLQ